MNMMLLKPGFKGYFWHNKPIWPGPYWKNTARKSCFGRPEQIDGLPETELLERQEMYHTYAYQPQKQEAYHHQADQYPNSYQHQRNFQQPEYRQNKYYENKENKNDPQSLGYYVSHRREREHDRDNSWSPRDQRHSQSPVYYDRKEREGKWRRSPPQRVHSRSPRKHPYNGSSTYRSRSPYYRSSSRHYSSRSSSRHGRSKSSSTKHRKRSREKDRTCRSRSSSKSETASESSVTEREWSPRKTREENPAADRQHTFDRRQMSADVRMAKDNDKNSRSVFSDSRKKSKNHCLLNHKRLATEENTKVEMTIGELSMSPISSEDFSQRSEEAESDGEIRKNDEMALPESKNLENVNKKEEGDDASNNKRSPVDSKNFERNMTEANSSSSNITNKKKSFLDKKKCETSCDKEKAVDSSSSKTDVTRSVQNSKNLEDHIHMKEPSGDSSVKTNTHGLLSENKKSECNSMKVSNYSCSDKTGISSQNQRKCNLTETDERESVKKQKTKKEIKSNIEKKIVKKRKKERRSSSDLMKEDKKGEYGEEISKNDTQTIEGTKNNQHENAGNTEITEGISIARNDKCIDPNKKSETAEKQTRNVGKNSTLSSDSQHSEVEKVTAVIKKNKLETNSKDASEQTQACIEKLQNTLIETKQMPISMISKIVSLMESKTMKKNDIHPCNDQPREDRSQTTDQEKQEDSDVKEKTVEVENANKELKCIHKQQKKSEKEFGSNAEKFSKHSNNERHNGKDTSREHTEKLTAKKPESVKSKKHLHDRGNSVKSKVSPKDASQYIEKSKMLEETIPKEKLQDESVGKISAPECSQDETTESLTDKIQSKTDIGNKSRNDNLKPEKSKGRQTSQIDKELNKQVSSKENKVDFPQKMTSDETSCQIKYGLEKPDTVSKTRINANQTNSGLGVQVSTNAKALKTSQLSKEKLAAKEKSHQGTANLDQSRSHTLSVKDKKRCFEECIKSKEKNNQNLESDRKTHKHDTKHKTVNGEPVIDKQPGYSELLKEKSERVGALPLSSTINTSQKVRERKHSGAASESQNIRERRHSEAIELSQNTRERKRSGAGDGLQNARERKSSGTLEIDSANKRTHSGSETSPVIVTGRMNRPSGDVFIPLGRPAEKKRKLISPSQSPQPVHAVTQEETGNKTTESSVSVTEERRSSVSELTDKFEKGSTSKEVEKTSSEENTAGPKKNLFGKNKKRISHYSKKDDKPVSKSPVKISAIKLPQKKSPLPSKNNLFKKFTLKRTPGSPVKSVKNDSVSGKKADNTSVTTLKDSSRQKLKMTDVQIKLVPIDNIFEKLKENRIVEQKTSFVENLKTGVKRPHDEKVSHTNSNEKKRKCEETNTVEGQTTKGKTFDTSQDKMDGCSSVTVENHPQKIMKEKRPKHQNSDPQDKLESDSSKSVEKIKSGNNSKLSKTHKKTHSVSKISEVLLQSPESEANKLGKTSDLDLKSCETKSNVNFGESHTQPAYEKLTSPSVLKTFKLSSRESMNANKVSKESVNEESNGEHCDAKPYGNNLQSLDSEDVERSLNTCGLKEKEMLYTSESLVTSEESNFCEHEKFHQNESKEELNKSKTEEVEQTKKSITNKLEIAGKTSSDISMTKTPDNEKVYEKENVHDKHVTDTNFDSDDTTDMGRVDATAGHINTTEVVVNKNVDGKVTEEEHCASSSQHMDIENDDAESDAGDIEPIQMFGSDFINDLCMDESYDNVLDANVYLAKLDGVKIKYCDDRIVTGNVDPDKKSEYNDSYMPDKSANNQTTCKVERKLKSTPRKRFAPQLESLGKMIDDEKEIDDVEIKEPTIHSAKDFSLEPKEVITGHLEDDYDDSELISNSVDLTPTKEVKLLVTSQWLEKAKNKVKVLGGLIKAKEQTRTQSDNQNVNTDKISDVLEHSETLNKRLYENGFVVSHTKLLKNRNPIETFAHFYPKKLFRSQNEQETYLGKCLFCQTCSMFFTPLAFTVHHDTHWIVEQMDTEKSKQQSYKLVKENDGDAQKLFEDFIRHFHAERSKGCESLPLQPSQENTSSVEEKGLSVLNSSQSTGQLPLQTHQKYRQPLPLEKKSLTEKQKQQVTEKFLAQQDQTLGGHGSQQELRENTVGETNMAPSTILQQQVAQRVPLSSRNVCNMPMINPLTARYIKQNTDQRNQPKSLSNFTGIPFASSQTSIISRQNDTSAEETVKRKGGLESSTTSTQKTQFATSAATEGNIRQNVCVSEQMSNAAVVEEKRRQLLHQLLELDDIHTGDSGLDLILLGRKYVHRGLATVNQEVLRLCRERAASDNVPQGQSSGKIPEGQSSGKVPQGQSSGKVPQEQSSGKVPQGQSSGKVPQGQSSGKVPQGQSSGKVPQGQSSVKVPQGQSSGKVPQGQSPGENRRPVSLEERINIIGHVRRSQHL